jgi:hypothetical protein
MRQPANIQKRTSPTRNRAPTYHHKKAKNDYSIPFLELESRLRRAIVIWKRSFTQADFGWSLL